MSNESTLGSVAVIGSIFMMRAVIKTESMMQIVTSLCTFLHAHRPSMTP